MLHPRNSVKDGAFIDPQLPARFAPFNVQRIGCELYVTYALKEGDLHDKVAGAGNGIINVFDLQGNVLTRLVLNGHLIPHGACLDSQLVGTSESPIIPLCQKSLGSCRCSWPHLQRRAVESGYGF
jgi:hypothetical protein